MKKAYDTPQLIIHGTVESITRHFGQSGVDYFYIGGTSIGNPGTGSTDWDLIPRKRK
jgi:hypothetical protein